jgi:phosphoribosyl 1,2-cyclic phosphodiesterase
LIAPAVGYRITSAGVALFCVPDLVSIHERHEALSGIQLYVGDRASIIRSILRHRKKVLIGHASVHDQLDWCRDEGVTKAVITHCGSQIVKAGGRATAARIQALGRERQVEARIAYDGLKLTVSGTVRDNLGERNHYWPADFPNAPILDSLGLL